jgi:bifunctional DNA primase/polymerase-like protein
MQENTPSTTTNVWRVPALPVVGVSDEPFATLYPIFRAAGYHPIPLNKGKKSPAITKYNQYAAPAVDIGKGHEQAWLKQHAGGNVGLVCGRPVHETDDGRPLYLTAIDVDVNDERVWDAVTGSMPDWEQAVIKTSAFQGVIEGTSRGFTMLVLSTLLFSYGKKYPLDKLPPFEHISGVQKDAGIDFISSGMQTVMPPSTHPDTGKPYVATHGLDLKAGWVRPVTELPIFDQAAFDRLAEALAFARTEPMLSPDHEQTALERAATSPSGPRERTLGGERTSEGLGEFIKGVQRILSNDWQDPKGRKNYERLFGQMADMWRVINEGELDEARALLILMGTDVHQHKVESQGQKWVDSEWRRARAYVEGECQTGAQIIAERQAAKAAALALPDSFFKVDISNDDETMSEEELRDYIEQIDIEGTGAKGVEPTRTGDIPEEVCNAAPGWIGDAYRDIRTRYSKVPAGLALFAALSATAAMSCRNFMTDATLDGGSVALYIIAAAGTGAGKDDVKKWVKSLRTSTMLSHRELPEHMTFMYGHPGERITKKKELTAMPNVVPGKPMASGSDAGSFKSIFEMMGGPSGFTGPAAFLRSMRTSAVAWYVFDEGGRTIKKFADTSDGDSIFALCRMFYSLDESFEPGLYAEDAKTQANAVMIAREHPMHFPHFNHFIMGTPKQLYREMGRTMVEDGSINRYCIAEFGGDEVISEEVEAKRLFPHKFGMDFKREMPPSVIEGAYKIAMFETEEQRKFCEPFRPIDQRVDVNAHYKLHRVPFDSENDEAAAMLAVRYGVSVKQDIRRLQKMDNSEADAQAAMMVRLAENMIRVATLAAISEDVPSGRNPMVRLHHVQWAIAFIKAVQGNLVQLIDSGMTSAHQERANETKGRICATWMKVMETFKKGKNLERFKVDKEEDGGRVWVQQSYFNGRLPAANREHDANHVTRELRLQGAAYLTQFGRTQYVRIAIER